MYTQCPNCQTLFRIRTEQLRAAAGKAHCCFCDNIFNAIENLREPVANEASPAAPTASANDLEDADQAMHDSPQQVSLSRLFEDLESEDQPLLMALDEDSPEAAAQGLNAADDGDILASNADETTPDQAVADLYPAELAGLFDSGGKMDIDIDVDIEQLEALENTQLADSADAHEPAHGDQPSQLNDSGRAAQHQESDNAPLSSGDKETRKDLPFQAPDGLQAIQPSDRRAPQSTATGRSRHGFAWSMLAMVLLLSALGQAAWLAREQLIAYPLARDLMQRFCVVTGCQLPQRRDPQRIEVLSRSVKSHPKIPHVLQILLTFSNRAAFDQPYPQIRLSLYSNINELIARRRFKPDEYLGTSMSDRSLIAAGQSVSVELILEDPGEQATGFKFDFF